MADPALVDACRALHPHWTTYVQAISTPIIAAIAAGFAGMIAYRQWRTARDKLKMDLFDKRYAVYLAYREYCSSITSPLRKPESAIPPIPKTLDAAEWLFNAQVNSLLNDLHHRYYQAIMTQGLAPRHAEFDLGDSAEGTFLQWLSKNSEAFDKAFAHDLKLKH
jgi:hypothetical protein